MKRIVVLFALTLSGCGHAAMRFPKDPHVLYTPTPSPDLIWYCERKAWGGARCDAWDELELRAWAGKYEVSLVCAKEKGFTKTCWRAQDMDDHGAYSY